MDTVESKDNLVVLDMNGIFTYRIYDGNHGFEIFYRPGSHGFIENLFKSGFEVGFFTSTTWKNANPIIRKLTPRKLLFKWTRDRCTLDPEPVKDHDVVKNLSSIWENPVINQKRIYGEHNTILVDDSVRKTRFNDPLNCIVPGEYDPSEKLDPFYFDNLLKEIKQRFSEIN